MRSGQITDAHQKLVDDLPAGEAEGLPKEPRPVLGRTRMMSFEPAGERPVQLSQRLDASCVLCRRLDFEPVADDPRIGEQPVDIGRPESGDTVDVEIRKGRAKRRPFLEDCQPGQSRLVDLENEPLEQHALLAGREAVLAIMIEAVHRMAGRYSAISGAQLTARGN